MGVTPTSIAKLYFPEVIIDIALFSSSASSFFKLILGEPDRCCITYNRPHERLCLCAFVWKWSLKCTFITNLWSTLLFPTRCSNCFIEARPLIHGRSNNYKTCHDQFKLIASFMLSTIFFVCKISNNDDFYLFCWHFLSMTILLEICTIMMTFNQTQIPFQSYAEPPWTLSNIFPEEQMDECPTCELRKGEGKNDYFNILYQWIACSLK